MITTNVFAKELFKVYDLVKFTKTKYGIQASKCKKGKPSGMSMYNVVEQDETKSQFNEHIKGERFTVLQQGIIEHWDWLNYKLNDEIYAKDGYLTTEKTPYRVGVVVPQGIYLDFLK